MNKNLFINKPSIYFLKTTKAHYPPIDFYLQPHLPRIAREGSGTCTPPARSHVTPRVKLVGSHTSVVSDAKHYSFSILDRFFVIVP
jgi:hypothetical protein